MFIFFLYAGQAGINTESSQQCYLKTLHTFKKSCCLSFYLLHDSPLHSLTLQHHLYSWNQSVKFALSAPPDFHPHPPVFVLKNSGWVKLPFENPIRRQTGARLSDPDFDLLSSVFFCLSASSQVESVDLPSAPY